MQGRRRGVAGTTAVALAALLVASCSDDTPSTPTTTSAPSTTTPSPSPTPTATPTADLNVPPARPEAMTTPGDEGAAAAASYFISLYPYIYATGDFSEWDALSAPECEFCSESRADVERMLNAGNRTTGAPIEILSSSGIKLSDEWYSAKLRVRQAEGSEVDSSGAVVSSNPVGVFDFDFAMSWVDGWRIDSVGIVPVEEG
ncbi:DUF6318 family protein [Cellulomonas sp. NPDC057328]|uniref:DUF6318 family protein n=1 Tax=Cellulomonas sp. NPDC057328 TaxID=3346101 RepID=UPI003628EFAD